MLGTTMAKEPHLMSFKEGERNSALTILAYCNVDIAGLLRMVEEEKTHAQFATSTDPDQEP